MPKRSCRSCIRFSTWACTETSSALTGSSATISLRPRDQRARDRDALALAAARTRAGTWSRSAARRPTASSTRRGALALLGAPGTGSACQRLGDDARDRAGAGRASRTGPGTPSGSRARARRSAAGASACRSWPSSTHAAGGRRLERHHQPRQRALARARLADHAEAAPGAQREAHAVERLHRRRRRASRLLARQAVVLDEAVDLAAAAAVIAADLRSGCSARVPGADGHRGRHRGAAGVDGQRAAIGERAAGRQVGQLGHAAGDGGQPRAARSAPSRGRAANRPRV